MPTKTSIQERRRRVMQRAIAYGELAGLVALCVGFVLALDLMTALFIHRALPDVSLLTAMGLCLLALGVYCALLEVAHVAYTKRTRNQRRAKGGDEE